MIKGSGDHATSMRASAQICTATRDPGRSDACYSGQTAVPGQSKSLIRAWYALTVLVLATLFAFVDRQVLVLVVEALKHDLRLSDIQIGLLQGLGFALFSVFASFPIAWLADRFERTWVLTGCVLFWSVSTAACGLAHSFMALFAGTIGVAAGEAALVPIVYSLIPDLFPDRGRMQANIIFFGATVLGMGLGLAFSAGTLGFIGSMKSTFPPALSSLAPWRLTFLALSIPGPAIALAIAFIGRTSRAHLGPSVSSTARASKIRLFDYFRVHGRAAILIFLAVGFNQLAGFAFFSWTPTAFVRLFGLSPQANGASFGFSYSCGAGFGLAIATVTARLWRRWAGTAAPVRAVAVMSLLVIVPTLMLSAATKPGQGYLLEGALISLVVAGLAMLPAMLQDMTPAALRARVIAVETIVYMLVGSCGPIAVGAISDHLGRGHRNLLIAVVAVMTFGFIVSAVCFRAAEPGYRKTVLAFQKVEFT